MVMPHYLLKEGWSKVNLKQRRYMMAEYYQPDYIQQSNSG
jgi:hypothetical protein